MAEIGRQVKYGVGVETTAGTPVAPTKWINQLAFDMHPVVTTANNESAWGNLFRTNSTTKIREHSEGTLEAKLTADNSGIILLGAFGAVSTAANADASGTVKDHTFTLNQNIAGKSLTFVRQDGLSTKAYALGRIGEWTLSVDLDDYVKYTANIMAKPSTATTATAAYVEETEFVAKHFTVNTGGDAISTVESFTLTVNPNLEADTGAGSAAPYGFSSRGYDASFEMTCRYNDLTFENAYRNGTDVELNLSIVNTDVTFGTAAHPALAIEAGRANITDWTLNEDLDGPITQTLTGTIHYFPSDARALRAVLTNTTASY